MNEELTKILESINNCLRFAEAKNGVLLALNGTAIFGVFQLLTSQSTLVIKYWEYAVALLIMFIISALITMISFVPILTIREKIIKFLSSNKHKKRNLIYFGNIFDLDVLDYLDMFHNRYFKDKEISQLDEDIAENIINNSVICVWKFKLFNWAIKLEIILFIVIIIICLFIN